MNNLLLILCIAMLLINLAFFFMYERLKPAPEDILQMVVIITAASLGRVVFAMIPQFQPVTALVIIYASVYGARRGYICGALCALISNMFLGQGPWTLFQMAAWGMVGLIAGLIGNIISTKAHKLRLAIFTGYGIIAAYLFSFITDLMTLGYLGEGLSVKSAAAVFVSGFLFQTGHVISNGIFLILFYNIIYKKLVRARKML